MPVKTMTSKERVRAAFQHQEPDRVPIDYYPNPGIDERLKAHFGLAADDHEGLAEALNLDFRYVMAPYIGPRLHPEMPERQVDPCYGVRTRWIAHGSGGYWDYCDFPIRSATIEDVEAWPMPSPDDYDYSAVARLCKQHERYAVVVICMPDIINGNGMLRGMEQSLVDLATDDEAGLRYLDRRLAIQLEVARRTLEAANGAIDIMWLGEDLGTQRGPIISLDLFRRHIRPRHQPFVDLARSQGVYTMMHSCGSSSFAFEDFIEMGVTAMQTLQPEARDMSPEYLKSRFGGRMVFHGSISTVAAVTSGTADEVVAECRRTLETMMPGGGYCFAPSGSLQDNSPTENVLAMYECAVRDGRYR